MRDREAGTLEFRDRFSVRLKMLAVGLAVTLATVFTGWVSYRAERDTAGRGLFLYDHILQSLSYARAAQRDFALLRNLARAAPAREGDAAAAVMIAELARDAGAADAASAVRLLVKETVENLRVAAERDLPPDLAERTRGLMTRVEQLKEPVLERLAGGAAPAATGPLGEMTVVAEDLELFVQDLAAEGFRVREQMGWQVRRAAWTIAAAVAAAILVAICASLLLGEIVARQVHAAADYSDRVASGELQRRVSVHGSTELASLMRSLDRMREAIRLQIGQIEELRLRAERMVDSMLPASVAARLRAGEEHIADARVEATIVFLDLVGFTELSRRFGAAHLVETLDSIFRRLDDAASRHGVEKIKTIGDAYLAAAGVTGDTLPDDAARCAAFALEARDVVRATGADLGYPLDVRIGIHNGPVVAGILGKDKLFFDVWGDAVNFASRLQTSAQTGEIRVSETAYWRLRGSFAMTALGAVELKGIGTTDAFVLKGRNPTDQKTGA
jgi:class 3 adenylate cyclase